MSRLFIDRPIFAWVIAIFIMLAGVLAVFSLPVNQYPNVAAPAVAIKVTYQGASAQTVQDTVVQVIEQQLSSLDGLRYIQSESNVDGSMYIIATFEQGTNPDIAQVQVQNKLSLAMPRLPMEVQQQGISVVKYQKNFMLVFGIVDDTGRMTNADLANYISSVIQDPVSRVKGVGDFLMYGSPYAMRIWLDPAKLNSFQLTPGDVIAAIKAQNVQVSSGELGGLPTYAGVQLNASIIGKTRMTTAEEFEKILLKVDANGSQVRIKDVAQVGLGKQNYALSGRFNGQPTAAMALRLATGANVLETIAEVKKTLKEMEAYFPKGLRVVYPYDTEPAVTTSINSIVKTLIEAIVLVFLVMFLFLQNFRATVITTLTIPVVVLGTFAVMLSAGFTINILTMFALVLAIGLLVDNAIVVVENVERIMHEERLSPKEATRKSMDQLQVVLVGIGLAISAVFVPMAFFGGSTGVIYRQFSITIVSAMLLSVLVALIFTPALCATMLKPYSPQHQTRNRFFRLFNHHFNKNARRYERGVVSIMSRPKRYMLVFGGIVIVVAGLFWALPNAFLPEDDQGVMYVQIQAPPGGTAERTEKLIDEVNNYLLKEEGAVVEASFTVNGYNFAGRGQNSAIHYIRLKPFSERSGYEMSAYGLSERMLKRFAEIKDAKVIPIVPPPIRELGNATGFNLYLQDNAEVGHTALMAARDQFLEMANKDPALKLVRPNGLSDQPQYEVKIDDEKARAHQVSIADINLTMSAAWGSVYVNDFIDRGRVKRVYVQGVQDARTSPEDFNKWYVRNAQGKMVPFSAFATGRWIFGSPKLERYKGIPAVEIMGQPAPGYSSGDAMAAVDRIAAKLPNGVGLAYTGLSYEERLVGSQSAMLLGLSLLVVFLCLAALYESWSIPFSVMLVVPLGVLGAVVATHLRGLCNDVFFQIGLLTTMGLSAKNAILIVEVAKELYEKEGMSLREAAALSARMRLRPIIMTSLAFILGTVPLVIASGAGSGSQHSIGTGVVGGTLAATFLAIYYVPLFYVVVAGLFEKKKKNDDVSSVATVEEVK